VKDKPSSWNKAKFFLGQVAKLRLCNLKNIGTLQKIKKTLTLKFSSFQITDQVKVNETWMF
jgi:hypothetical protein